MATPHTVEENAEPEFGGDFPAFVGGRTQPRPKSFVPWTAAFLRSGPAADASAGGHTLTHAPGTFRRHILVIEDAGVVAS